MQRLSDTLHFMKRICYEVGWCLCFFHSFQDVDISSMASIYYPPLTALEKVMAIHFPEQDEDIVRMHWIMDSRTHNSDIFTSRAVLFMIGCGRAVDL